MVDTNHNIVQIYNNVLWDWQYSAEYFLHSTAYEEYSTKYCQSQRTLLWT